MCAGSNTRTRKSSGASPLLLGLLFILQSVCVMAEEDPINRDCDLIVDKDYLVSLCKKLQSEFKRDSISLDDMSVSIYRRGNFVVVSFTPKSPSDASDVLIHRGYEDFYFVKSEDGGYRFIKRLHGQ